MRIIENKINKALFSENYNYIFRYKDGFFMRWGKTTMDDPQWSPFGNEILDLEISSGKCMGKCKFCYKDNGGDQPTHNMTFEEFKIIFKKLPRTVCQIAFGICDISTNSDFFAMMEYARENNVVPNYTCHGLDVTPEVAKRTSELCGAVAVSLVNKEKTYDSIKMFSIDNNMNQCNLHFMLSTETYDRAFKIIDDISSDPRLKKLNAIVFLQYKHKNPKSNYHSVLNVEKYTKLINYCNEKQINYGFDSCSATLFIDSIKDKPNRKELEMMAEPCEAACMSYYINCKGIAFPCSFCEDMVEGIDVLNCEDFLKDVWMSKRSKKWRKKLINNKRNCPIYELSMEKC